MGVGFRQVTLGSPVPVPALPVPTYLRGFVNPWRTLGGVGFRRVTLGSPVPVPALPVPTYPRGFVNPWRTLGGGVATLLCDWKTPSPSRISSKGGGGGVVEKHPLHLTFWARRGGMVGKHPPLSRILSEGGGVVGKHPPSVLHFEWERGWW